MKRATGAKYLERASIAVLVLVLAIVIHHVRVMVFGDDLRRAILSDLFLLDGKPQWRLFQSRLLGPFAERGFMHATSKSDLGYIVFDLVGFGAALILAWRVGASVVRSRAGALAAMLTMALGVVALFAPDWFFGWDVLGPAFFMAFAWLVVIDAKPIWIAMLFSVAIWNREDALFIALFMVVQPVAEWWCARAGPARPPIDWRRVALGMACIAGGMVLITVLRRLLLVHETGPDLFGARQPTFTLFFQWNVPRNLDFLHHGIVWTDLEMPGFVGLPPVVIVAACVYLARAPHGRFLGYALINLAMTLATLMFGFTPELRQWVDLLPVVVVATSVALARADQSGRL